MSATLAPSPFSIAADIVDPPRWEASGRKPLKPHQSPDPMLGKAGGPSLQLWEAGRGSGKTEGAARYYTEFMRMRPGSKGRILAPTLGDAVESCINGPSGILDMDPEVTFLSSSAGGAKLRWPNGSEALVLGLHSKKDVERLRASGNRDIDWWEEAAAMSWLQEAWDQAAFGLRRGDHPHAIMSTTPRNTKAYKAIRNMAETHVTKGTMFDNIENLPQSFIDLMTKKYEGTRLGRQELYGELLEDVEGALWSAEKLERALYGGDLPDMAVVVVAVDPAVSATADSDDTGIIVVGLGMDGFGYTLADRTVHAGPDGWGQAAVDAYREFRADRIVGERNNGGDLVEHVITTIDHTIPYKGVWASRGKATRAEPISTLYGNPETERPGIIRHVPGLSDLEDQLTTWVPGEEGQESPDRLDAMVWGHTELFFEEEEEESIVEDYEPVAIGADI